MGTDRTPFSTPEPKGAALSPIELLEVYQRALYEALTRADDDTPEWAHLVHEVGTAVVMDVERFVPDVVAAAPAGGERRTDQ